MTDSGDIAALARNRLIRMSRFREMEIPIKSVVITHIQDINDQFDYLAKLSGGDGTTFSGDYIVRAAALGIEQALLTTLLENRRYTNNNIGEIRRIVAALNQEDGPLAVLKKAPINFTADNVKKACELMVPLLRPSIPKDIGEIMLGILTQLEQPDVEHPPSVSTAPVTVIPPGQQPTEHAPFPTQTTEASSKDIRETRLARMEDFRSNLPTTDDHAIVEYRADLAAEIKYIGSNYPALADKMPYTKAVLQITPNMDINSAVAKAMQRLRTIDDATLLGESLVVDKQMVLDSSLAVDRYLASSAAGGVDHARSAIAAIDERILTISADRPNQDPHDSPHPGRDTSETIGLYTDSTRRSRVIWPLGWGGFDKKNQGPGGNRGGI